MEGELKHKTAKGVSWGFVENVAGTGLLALVNLVLARLLTPSEFGLVGMTAIFITLSTSLVDSGFTAALTRKKNLSGGDLDTVFYFNFATALLLYGVLYFSSPYIASFFNQPVLVPMVRVLGLSILISAAAIVQKAIFIKKIDFRTQAVISLLSSFVSGVVSIWMAYAGFGVWSLVALQISRAGITALLLWLFSEWKPSLRFSWSSLKEMFAFGGRLQLASIIGIVWNEIYSIIIGKVYTASVLGQYSRADKFRNMVTQNVALVMQRVSFPVLASIQDEKERQVRAYRKVLRTTVLISFTSVAGLIAVADAAILTLFGDQWIPAVHYLRILCLSGLFVPVIMCGGNMINANGRSDLTLYLEILKTVLAVVPVLLGIYISIDALLWGMVGVHFIVFVITGISVSKVMEYSFADHMRDVLPVLAISLVMMCAVWPVSLAGLPYWLELAVQVAAGAAIVIFIYEKVYRCEEYYDIRNILLKALSKFGGRK